MISRRTFLVSTAAGTFRPWRLLGRLAPPDLAILHTNDVHGRVEVEGAKQGLAYLAAEIRRQRARYGLTMTLDAGDIVHGTPMEQRHGPEPVLTAFDAIGYDCATVGNHEFDFGPENLKHAARFAKFPFLSANVRTADGQPWGPLNPYLTFNRGRRIGIFGLTTLETPKIQWPRTIESIHFNDPFEAARNCIAELRPKVDLLICLSHLGYTEDQKLAHEAPGMDLIIGGHSHTRLEKAKLENGIPIVQTGAYGKALGRIEVRYEGQKPTFDYQLIDIPLTAAEDPDVERQYAPYAKELDQELDELLTTLAHPLVFTDLKSARTPTGEFLARCVKVAHGTDVGLFSSSQINGTLPAGPVRRKDVYNCMAAYTRQHIVKMRVPADLAQTQFTKAGSTIQVSGQISGQTPIIAGPAHVMQDLFLNKPNTEILYDNPLGPSVRDAIMDGLKSGLA